MPPKPIEELPIVDSHLDLAENVTLFGRDLTSSVEEIRTLERREKNQATVSLPELERGEIAVVCASVTAGFLTEDVGEDFEPKSALYRVAEEAEAQALAQIRLYESWQSQGRVRILKSAADLEHHLRLWKDDRKPGLVLLMEGADPIVHASDLPEWWRRGLRMIGPAFGDTRYARGVGGGREEFASGGFTTQGFELIERMADLGFIWDVSHQTGEGVREGLDLGFTRVCASHANARALVPTDRHLGDDVIRAIAERGGVVGLVLYNGFLEPRWSRNRMMAVTLREHLRRHAEHVASLAGWECVGIGSDLDGGFGLEESPREIETVADLHRAEVAFPAEFRDAALGGNWLRFLRDSLPESA